MTLLNTHPVSRTTSSAERCCLAGRAGGPPRDVLRATEHRRLCRSRVDSALRRRHFRSGSGAGVVLAGVEPERGVQGARGALEVGGGGDDADADRRRRDHLDVDALVGERAEHLGGDARAGLHARHRRG